MNPVETLSRPPSRPLSRVTPRGRLAIGRGDLICYDRTMTSICRRAQAAGSSKRPRRDVQWYDLLTASRSAETHPQSSYHLFITVNLHCGARKFGSKLAVAVMLTVYGCLVNDHDLRLVALAAVVCSF